MRMRILSGGVVMETGPGSDGLMGLSELDGYVGNAAWLLDGEGDGMAAAGTELVTDTLTPGTDVTDTLPDDF